MNNLTAKEKAEELVDKYRNTIMSFLSDNMKDQNAKQCALIAVDEIIEYAKTFGDTTESDIKEFERVKQEIINYDTGRSI